MKNDLCAGNIDKFDENYLSIGKIGSGGYGTVYLCLDKNTDEYVAVKIMPLDIE